MILCKKCFWSRINTYSKKRLKSLKFLICPLLNQKIMLIEGKNKECEEFIEYPLYPQIIEEIKKNERIGEFNFNCGEREDEKERSVRYCRIAKCKISRKLIEKIMRSKRFKEIICDEKNILEQRYYLLFKRAKEIIAIMETKAFQKGYKYLNKYYLISSSLYLSFIELEFYLPYTFWSDLFGISDSYIRKYIKKYYKD